MAVGVTVAVAPAVGFLVFNLSAHVKRFSGLQYV